MKTNEFLGKTIERNKRAVDNAEDFFLGDGDDGGLFVGLEGRKASRVSCH